MATSLPPAFGVPGLSGAPQWWNPAGAPRVYSSSLIDPRWRGATRRGFGNGSGDEGVFRGLHMIEGASPVLYLSFQVFNDPSEGTNADGIYIGFQTPSGARYIIKVDAYDHVASFDAGAVGAVETTRIDAAGTTVIANPAWMNDARSWLSISGSPQKYSWAVNLRVPTQTSATEFDDTGINLGSLTAGATFRMWSALIKDLGPAVAAYYMPRTGAEITVDPVTLLNVLPTNAATWEVVNLGTGSAGISLDAWDVGTTNNDPTSGLPAPHEILVSATGPTTNHLFAKPMNATGGSVAAHSLSATFRTANWGSQADFTFAAGATPWEEILPGTLKDNAAAFANGSKGEIAFDWTISAAEAADWLPGGTKWTHQCMLVTLSGPYDFINDSVYRNMDFVKASEFERLAQISVQGARPAGAGDQDVYVYIDRFNMPYELKEPAPPPNLKEAIALIERRHGGGGGGDFTHAEGFESPPEGSPPEDDPNPPQAIFDELAKLVPAVRFHVYRTTPARIRVGGTVKPVVDEQTSFGYFVLHEGDVYGWDQILGGDFEPTDVPGLYHLKVPRDGKVVINTKVRGYEQPPPADRPVIEPAPPQPGDGHDHDHHKGCLGVLVALVAALVAVFKRRKK